MRLAITTGDPRGIGPEVVAAACREPVDGVEFVRIESRETGLDAVDRACDLALKREVAGIVTGPVSKERIAASGVPFSGHTEYLAVRCGVRRPVMMFAGERFRVALATTHVSLRNLPRVLTADVVTHVLRTTADALKNRFGIPDPRIAVAGLNPHAGEGGLFGREESEVVEPAMELARADGVTCEGPFAADTIFRREGFDGIVAMFHDQALPAVKAIDPLAVNVTLGLPFVRTSPDHGTAFDIAGRGKADPAPMRRAIEVAAQMVRASGDLL